MSRAEYARRVVIAASIGALFVAGLIFLRYVAHVLLILFAGILLATVVDGVGRWLCSVTGLPRRAGALGAIFGTLVLLGLVGWWVGPELVEQFGQLAERIPAAIQQGQEYLEERGWGQELIGQVGDSEGPSLGDLAGGAAGLFTSVLGAIANLLIILFLCIYLAYEPGVYRDAVLDLVPSVERDRIRDVLSNAGSALRLWMIGQLGAMAVVGVLTAVALTIAGVPAALALGVIAGLLDFVPIIGPLIAAVPAIIIGLGEGLGTGVVVALIFTAVQQIESYIVTPLFQRGVVSLPPALVLGAQVVLAVLFGLLGIFLSTPLLVVVIVLVQTLYVEDVLGEDVPVMGSD